MHEQPMSTALSTAWLRKALAIDAAAAGMIAVLQLLAPHPIARLLGLPVELLVGSGAVLAGWAALLVWLATAGAVSRAALRLVVAGNLLWAIGCAALCAWAVTPPTALGAAYLLLQAAAALVFGIAQAVGLVRSAQPVGRAAGLAWKNNS
jgi:hypothetical protein